MHCFCRVLILTLVLGIAATPAVGQTETVASPNGRIQVTVTTEGPLTYAVTHDGELLVEASPLGVVLSTGDTLGTDVRLVQAAARSHDETWTQPWGEVETIRDHHRELHLALAEDERRMDLRVRVFDDGVGFRYEWPAQDGLASFEIMDERTGFRFARDAEAWWIRAYEWNRYEYLYENTPLSQAGSVLHTPFTLAFAEGPFVAVHEAALVDYAAMSLRRSGPLAYEADLAPWATGVRVYAEAPAQSPWRVLLIGDTPGALVTNYTVLNLNEPNTLGDVSWVQPGKYVGIWWGMHLGERTWWPGPRLGATTERAQRYIDFAAAHDFDGVLVEGWNVGWDADWLGDGRSFSFTDPIAAFDLEAVAAYARERGTRLIGHHETAGNVPGYAAQMDSAYALMAELGVTSVKTGYVQWGMNFPRTQGPGVAPGDTAREWNYGQYMVNHYRRTLEAAARHQLSLNIHEPIKSTGLRRTYPNLLTTEGARGQEFNSPGGGGNGPGHVPTLVFTRLLAGPMDFTPGIFDIAAADEEHNRVPTTLAGQLALYVVLFSPLHMAADLVEHYAPHLDALQFIKDVPVDWADTRVLEGAIGEHVTIARQDRHSDDWYLGAVTNEEPRTVAVALAFLDAGRTYTATVYRDAEDADWRTNPEAYAIESRTVTADAQLRIPLAPGGGLAIRFAPEDGATP
ncbi:MAG: glycoside hydrolase family 97 protein [Bacteroidetes bacterium]|jgi:alpha-glucosidase|nr:glycoside hydrolase family 97 protein [Bacteroidota bacterium]